MCRAGASASAGWNGDDAWGASGPQKRSRQRRGAGRAQTQTWGRKTSWGSDDSGGSGWSRQTTAASEEGSAPWWGKQPSSGSEAQAQRSGRAARHKKSKTAGSSSSSVAAAGGGAGAGAAAAAAASSRTGPAQEPGRAELADLTPYLIKCGVYEEYKRWREGYRRWREGEAKGACGEGCSAATTEGPLRLSNSWRDAYRSWRAGGARGARGEMEAQGRRPRADSDQTSAAAPCASDSSAAPSPAAVAGGGAAAAAAPGGGADLPPVVYDVVAGGEGGQPALVPSDGPEIAPMLVKDFPPEAVLTVRVFRFFEDRSDEAQAWERNLLNVNSGSLFWLPWHLAPNMHTKAGAKYGTWFTIHYVQVLAKHFTSAYHMCNEGYNGGAKTFGCSCANSKAITGESMPMPEGYFWYVSPAAGKEHLRAEGWQHLDRAGPFDGKALLAAWQNCGSPMEVRVVQGVLAKVVEDAAGSRLQ